MRLPISVLALTTLALTACPAGDRPGPDESDEPTVAACEAVGDPSDASTTVDVELVEYAVEVDPVAMAGPTIAFRAHNSGTEAHELVIVAGADASVLPTDDDGALDESLLGGDVLIGEIEPFAPDTDCTGVFDLEPGAYVLLCNVVEDGEAHFAEGMFIEISVTG